MTWRRLLVGSFGALTVLVPVACSDSDTSSCTRTGGAEVCLAGDGALTLEGFLPGSTVTVTTGVASGATATGAGTGRQVVIGADGRPQAEVRLVPPPASTPVAVVGVSATNRPVKITLTAG